MILLLACSSPDPQLVAQGEAVAAFREGTARFENDPASARAHFERARKADDDPLLAAWMAVAAGEAGQLETAIRELYEVLERDPDFAEARYDLACFLARAGRLDEAGEQLRLALRYDIRRPRQAMVDPDFAPHLDHPAFRFLPAQLLLVTVDVPTKPLFWGNEARVRVRVLGADAAPVRIEGPMTGPVQLVKLAEDVIETSEGPARELTWTYKVRAAGVVTVGPLTVHAAGHQATVGARTFTTTAPPGKTYEDAVERPRVPDEPAATGAKLEGTTLWVRALPGDHVELDPSPTEAPLEMQVLDRSALQAQVWRYAVREPTRVRIRRAGTTVYEGP